MALRGSSGAEGARGDVDARGVYTIIYAYISISISIYIHICVYTYVCVCACVCVCVCIYIHTHTHTHTCIYRQWRCGELRTNFSVEKDSEVVLGVWLPAPLRTPRALPDHGAIWPLAVGVEKDLGGINV